MRSHDILYMEERLEVEASRFFRCMPLPYHIPPDSWALTPELTLEVVKLFEAALMQEKRLLFHTWRGTYNHKLLSAQANQRGGRLIDLFVLLHERYKQLKDESQDRTVDTGTATRQDGAVQQRLHGDDMG